MQQILLYFAYGSNLHPGRMASRCPAAKYLGPARLPNYRLVERHNADIDYAVGSTVHGALYAITPEDLARLDSFEGYPKAYRRLSLEIVYRRMACFAITYEMTGATKSERDGKPYPEEYRLICSEGARLRKIKNAFKESLRQGTPGKPKELPMKSVNLIVYGTLRRGEPNSHFCRNAMSISPCEIQGTLYDTGWGFPAFVPEGKGIVKAEFVVLPESDWPAIDRLESYPTLYDRRKIGARLPNGSVEIGWVYIMNNLPAGARVTPGGDWRNRTRKK